MMDWRNGRSACWWLTKVGLMALLTVPGMAFSQADRATIALDQGDCEAAVDALNRGVADGDLRSMFLVGQMFERGVCLKVNPARAATIYQQAATRGDTASARSLALLEAQGAGVPQSYAKAGYWLAVSRGTKPGVDAPSENAFSSPDQLVKTYVQAVHDLAEDTMVYPPLAAAQGVRGNVVMRFDPRSATASLVSSVDDQSNATNHLGPSKHLFERALATSYDVVIKVLPRPDVPATGDFATDHEVRFSRDRNSRDGPYGYQGLHR